MKQIPYKVMAITLVGTAIVVAVAFAVAVPFNFIL